MIAVLSVPIVRLPRSFPARKFSGRTLDRMISITRDDFSSVTRLPTIAANVIMNIIMMSTPKVIVSMFDGLILLPTFTLVMADGGVA